MKLLLITQKADRKDPVLGFMHGWISELAARTEKIQVICLEEGEHHLPSNVNVFSLGKEQGKTRFEYLIRFYSFIWSKRGEYDAVFVHMNQEYLLLAGWLWRFLGKRVYMWRNHHAGDTLTDIAASFCNAVFCTSKYSYTAKYAKTRFMPVGIDTDLFKSSTSIQPEPHSILFLSRIAPVKKAHVLIDALKILAASQFHFKAHLYGNALSKDAEYYDGLKEKVKAAKLEDRVTFFPGVPNDQTVKLYQSHSVHVNLSTSGMYDKTIFEAMACGTLELASNKNLEDIIDSRCIFTEGDSKELAEKLKVLLTLPSDERAALVHSLSHYAHKNQSLKELGVRLSEAMLIP